MNINKFFSGLSLAAALAFAISAPQSAKADGWKGGYFGAHAGYATTEVGIDGFSVNLPEPDGFIGGIHGGYNFQSGNLVYGIEADVSFGNLEDGISYSAYDEDDDLHEGDLDFSTEYLASIRGRLGYASDTFLLYATAGVAWTELEVKDVGTTTYDFDGATEDFAEKFSLSNTGYVVGGGAAMKFTPKLSAHIEGLYYDFAEEDNVDYSVTSVRGGLTFHFN